MTERKRDLADKQPEAVRLDAEGHGVIETADIIPVDRHTITHGGSWQISPGR